MRGSNDADALDDYTPRALARVWRAQHFSYWMTTMLHRLPGASDFDVRRQLGELASLVGVAGRVDVPRRGLHRLAGARLTPSPALPFR